MTTVVFTVTTQKQTFAAGTVDTPYVFNVNDQSGVTVSSVSSVSSTAQVDIATPGSYTVSVTKNGVSVSTAFTVAPLEVSLEVPVSIVATVG